PREIKVGGMILRPTVVFDTYWNVGFELQSVFMRRVRGAEPPWTSNPIVQTSKFTRPYRATDRTSQYVIKEVLYKGAQSAEEIFFRALLFKLFNKVETWEKLSEKLGHTPSWKTFDYERYASALDAIKAKGPIYSAAYIIGNPEMGAGSCKHRNHLLL